MNSRQVANIPTRTLFQPGTEQLREWLAARGLRMSLLELEEERARRRRPAKDRAR